MYVNLKNQPGCLGDERMQTVTDESNYVTNEPHNHTEENREETKVTEY